MSDRYKQVKLYDNFKFCPTCPIDILKGAIYIDNITNKVVFQLKFVNTQHRNIKAVYITIVGYDELGKELENKEYSYLDLNVFTGQEFGTDQLKDLDNNTIRNIEITINKVIYADNEVWENKNAVAYDRTSLKEIDKDLLFIAKRELTKQGIQLDNIYYPTEDKDYWTCVCGTYNSNSNDKCYNCGCSKEQTDKAFSKEQLIKDLEAYNTSLEEEEKLRDDKIKTIIKKIKKISIIVIPLIIITILTCIALHFYKDNTIKNKIKSCNFDSANSLLNIISSKDIVTKYDEYIQSLIKEYNSQGKYEETINLINYIYFLTEKENYDISNKYQNELIEAKYLYMINKSEMQVYDALYEDCLDACIKSDKYKDDEKIKELYSEFLYNQISKNLESGKRKEAVEIAFNILDYKDSKEIVYQYAIENINKSISKYEIKYSANELKNQSFKNDEICNYLLNLQDYKDSEEKLKERKYKIINAIYEEYKEKSTSRKELKEIKSLFIDLGNYKDTSNRIVEIEQALIWQGTWHRTKDDNILIDYYNKKITYISATNRKVTENIEIVGNTIVAYTYSGKVDETFTKNENKLSHTSIYSTYNYSLQEND